MQKRLAEKQTEEYDKLLERIKARESKEEKKDELLKKRDMERREESKLLMNKLKDSFQKVEVYKKQEEEKWQRAREEREEHIAEVINRRNEQVLTAQEEMVKTYQEKEQKIMVRMTEKREKEANRAMEADESYHEKLTALQVKMEERQRLREESFKTSEEGQKRAQEVVATRNQERTEAAREGLEKRFTKHEAAMVNLKKAKAEKRKEIMHKMNTRLGPDSPARTKELQDAKERRAEQREVMEELVLLNQERLQRREEFAREQIMARIQENNARVDTMIEQRAQLKLQRTLILKESLAEKARLEEQMRNMKVVPAPPPESEEKDKEAK